MLRIDAPVVGQYVIRFALVAAWTVLAAGCGSSSPTEGPSASLTASGPGEEASQPIVELKTTAGVIKLQLDDKRAPETVENFLVYVERGFYNGTIFHQVEKGYALLGGGYTPDLQEKQGRYPIRNEANNGLTNKRGTIAMARMLDAINSATCHFVINLADNTELDHQGDTPEQYGFCVFGRVVSGAEVLDKIAAMPVEQKDQFTALPRQAVVIETATRLR